MRFDDDEVFLVVVAHPDDEVLGFGGTAYQLTQNGHRVHSAIVVGDADARQNRPKLADLHADTDEAHRVLGMETPIRGTFPNIALNTVAHLELVQFIEKAIRKTEPDIIVSVHPGDINDDHHQTSRACQAAARMSQRQADMKPVRGLLMMEILSSTDWAILPTPTPFRPQMYVEIGDQGLAEKVAALDTYRGVVRSYPHARSDDSVRALATLRGSDAGLMFAEAFEVGFLHQRRVDV